MSKRAEGDEENVCTGWHDRQVGGLGMRSRRLNWLHRPGSQSEDAYACALPACIGLKVCGGGEVADHVES